MVQVAFSFPITIPARVDQYRAMRWKHCEIIIKSPCVDWFVVISLKSRHNNAR